MGPAAEAPASPASLSTDPWWAAVSGVAALVRRPGQAKAENLGSVKEAVLGTQASGTLVLGQGPAVDTTSVLSSQRGVALAGLTSHSSSAGFGLGASWHQHPFCDLSP